MWVVPSVSVGKLRRAVVNGKTHRPGISDRIVDIHFVGRIWRGPPTAHDIHLVTEVKRPRFACGVAVWRRCVVDGIRYRVIYKGVCSIGKSAGPVISVPPPV